MKTSMAYHRFAVQLAAHMHNDRRFRKLPDIILSAILFNPDRRSRAYLQIEETEKVQKFIQNLEFEF